MNERPDEMQIYLAGGSEVSRAYRQLGAPEPPAALDRIVRDQARLRKPARLLSWPKRWLMPIAAAATVVLGVLLLAPQVIHNPAVQPVPIEQPADPPQAEIGVTTDGPRDATSRLQKAGADTARQSMQKIQPAADSGGDTPLPSGSQNCASSSAEPERWLACIRRLRTNGETAAAQAEERVFSHRFPDHPGS